MTRFSSITPLVLTVMLSLNIRAAETAFTNLLAIGESLAGRSDVAGAVQSYEAAERLSVSNAPDLCVLARHYCELTYATNAPAAQKEFIDRALRVSLQAVRVAPTNATAHACVAVSYAKSCHYVGVKERLENSRLFKLEAEKAIALDPREDTAYYLIGRWHLEIAQVNPLSRAVVRLVYGGLPKASYAEAVRYFSKAAELAPGRILHHAGLAMAYRATGETKLELAELTRCGELKPADREDREIQRDTNQRLAELRR